MATILEFRASSSRGASHGLSNAGAVTAEIVLFPGIRYERWSEEAQAAPRQIRRARKRDMLEIDD